MMAGDRTRASLGFANALDDFDPEAWHPRPSGAAPAPQERQRTRAGAEALGFRSREAATEGQGVEPPVRRRRTGRNRQFNLKARSETIEAYCRIADAQGWGLGETLEHAVALLEDRYGQG